MQWRIMHQNTIHWYFISWDIFNLIDRYTYNIKKNLVTLCLKNIYILIKWATLQQQTSRKICSKCRCIVPQGSYQIISITKYIFVSEIILWFHQHPWSPFFVDFDHQLIEPRNQICSLKWIPCRYIVKYCADRNIDHKCMYPWNCDFTHSMKVDAQKC